MAKDKSVEKAGEEKPGEVCLVDGCGREANIRGLCSRCYTAARKLVNEKKTTWETLEEAGLAKPLGGGARGVFGQAFTKALGGDEPAPKAKARGKGKKGKAEDEKADKGERATIAS
jgi:hypothetical protein